jgi:hypothetical protein
MSSPTDRPDKPDDHSAYAPKWVRDSNRERRARKSPPTYRERKLRTRSEEDRVDPGSEANK